MNPQIKNSNTNSSLTILPPNIPSLKNQINVIGLSIILLLKSYLAIFTFKVPRKLIIEQIVSIGFNTLPMVILMTTFAGMVISLETAKSLQEYGGRDAIGALICLTSVIEIAPVFVSFAIAAQAGTAITAELAHMQITEQIAAMRLFKVNPVNYLVASRLIGMIYSLIFAVIIGAFFAIMGGLLVANLQAGIEVNVYLDSVWRALRIKDFFKSFIKAFILANYLIAIHTAFGLGARGGAKEVGQMTSYSTVWSTVGIICIDAFLDYLMY